MARFLKNLFVSWNPFRKDGVTSPHYARHRTRTKVWEAFYYVPACMLIGGGLAYALAKKIELKYDTIPEEMATIPAIPTLAQINVEHPLLKKERYSVAFDKGTNPYMRRDSTSTSFPTWLLGTRNALGGNDPGVRLLEDTLAGRASVLPEFFITVDRHLTTNPRDVFSEVPRDLLKADFMQKPSYDAPPTGAEAPWRRTDTA